MSKKLGSKPTVIELVTFDQLVSADYHRAVDGTLGIITNTFPTPASDDIPYLERLVRVSVSGSPRKPERADRRRQDG